MKRASITIAALLVCLSSSNIANAWFIFIPTGAIVRAMETDPDSIVVSNSDKLFGQCAGYHVNQAQRGLTRGNQRDVTNPAAIPQETTRTAESQFHSDMADIALARSSDKDKVKSLAEAYSVRWGRVASADREANLQYGRNLAQGCFSNDIPLRHSDYPAWQTRQEEKKRQQAEVERKRLEAAAEEQRRLRAEEASKVEPRVTSTSTTTPTIDYMMEAKKSARILGCSTNDVRITGAENNNVLMSASCGTGQDLLLVCDKTGTCLKR
jgi:hypothetical protein